MFAKRRRVRKRRKGAAIVELAVCLPVMTLLVFGTLELCELMFLKQSMSVASYEAARLAARKDSTSAMVIGRCESILADRRVDGATVTLDPGDITGLPRGTAIQVNIRAPLQANNTTALVLNQGLEVRQSTTMLRE